MIKSMLMCSAMIVICGGSLAVAQDTKVDGQPLDGASSLSETHGDWTVNCAVIAGAKQCRMSQQQFSVENNNQRLLAIEFLPEQDSNLNGTLAMPFGLALAKGVVLAVDDTKIAKPAQFSTCYMVGCVVPLRLDATAAQQLQSGSALNLEAVTAETLQPIKFKISLNGFASAYARLLKLAAQ